MILRRLAARPAAGLLLAVLVSGLTACSVSMGFGVFGGRGVGGHSAVGAGVGVSVPVTGEVKELAPRLEIGSECGLPGYENSCQRSPALAYGRGTHLIVWREGWNGLGGGSDILAARLDELGRRRDRKPIAISAAPGAQDSPDVAFCAGSFLVVWGDFRSGKDYDVWGAMLDLDGKLRRKPFMLAGGAGGQALPAVTSDGTGTFLVVWQDSAGGKFFDVRGVRLSAADGKVLDADPIVLMPRGEEPDVVWAGGKFLVCQKWYAALVGADGKPAQTRRIWHTRAVLTPAAVAAWDRPLVFMNTEPRHDPWGWGGGGAIIGVSVDPDGTSPELGWIGGKRVSDAAKADGKVRNCLDAARWRNHPGWPSGMPGGLKNTHEGTWPSGRVAAAYNGRSVLVAWTRARIADKSRLAERDIYVRRVTRGWSYPDPGKIRVTAAPLDEGDPAMSAGKTGRAILAYEAVQPGGGVLIRYRLLLEGEDKSGPRVVHTRRWSDTEMSLVFDEPVEPESASRAENYTIEGLAVKSAAWDEDPRTLGREVRLVTGTLERGRKYVVRVKGVKDRSERGNAADGRDFSFVAKPGTSARGEFIEKWLTVGPFPHSWKTAYVDVKRVRPSDGQAVEVRPAAELEALMKDALGEERWARERHAEKFAERFGGGRKWKAAKSRGGAILPLSREYGELVFATAYAHVYVYSPVSRSALLRLDATDAHRAWVNGRQVSFDDRMKTGRGLHDYTNGAKLRLSAGWNRLLVQQSNRFGRWQLAAQLTDPEGRPLGDLTWSLDEPR